MIIKQDINSQLRVIIIHEIDPEVSLYSTRLMLFDLTQQISTLLSHVTKTYYIVFFYRSFLPVIISFLKWNNMLNKRSELVAKCHHKSKYWLSNLAPPNRIDNMKHWIVSFNSILSLFYIMYMNKESKVGDCSRGRPESFLFNSYYTKISEKAQLLS